MRASNTGFLRLLPSLIVGGICVASLYAAVQAVAAWRERSQPHIGDILAFRGADRDGTKLAVAMSGGGRCTLDLSVLQGGSMVVEAPVPGSPGQFLVHWAGRLTAQGPGDCGHAADLVLDTGQLQTLTSAAATTADDAGA